MGSERYVYSAAMMLPPLFSKSSVAITSGANVILRLLFRFKQEKLINENAPIFLIAAANPGHLKAWQQHRPFILKICLKTLRTITAINVWSHSTRVVYEAFHPSSSFLKMPAKINPDFCACSDEPHHDRDKQVMMGQ